MKCEHILYIPDLMVAPQQFNLRRTLHFIRKQIRNHLHTKGPPINVIPKEKQRARAKTWPKMPQNLFKVEQIREIPMQIP